MTSLAQHPVLPFALAALLAPLAGPVGRRLLGVMAPLAALAMLLALPAGATASVTMLGHEWILLRADALGRVFAFAFAAYAVIAGIFAWEEAGAGPKVASLGVAGAGIGVVLAGDLLSLFVFWEWLTVTSLFLIWFGNSSGSWAAGLRYLSFHLLGATVMLIGILIRVADGHPMFEALPQGDLASGLILLGMLTNAAVPPLHAWLSDAYPRASVFGTVFLAAFTTKAAVYALTRGFAGTELLVWAGTIMALFGVWYAVLENDIRRLLSYHIISQVGYMVTGVGIGTALALNGTVSHAFSHIFYKGLLMMAAGAVIYATGRRRLHELGALAGPLRWVMVFMVIGAFSISGVPLLNGFVSKSMIISAASYTGRAPVELLLFVVSMGTFLSTALKLPKYTFLAEDRGARVTRAVPASMYLAMALAALVCIVTGLFPAGTLYRLLPFDATYQPFTAHHFIESLQLLLATALGFWLLRHLLASDVPLVTRDVDRLYRAPIRWAVEASGNLLKDIGRRASTVSVGVVDTTWRVLNQYHLKVGTPTLAAQTFIIIGAMAIATWVVVVGR